MTLLDQITSDLNCDETRALRGLGPLFMLLKLACPRDTFAKAQEVVPDAMTWAHASARGDAGRTGELLTLITPGNIRARILAEGFSEAETDQLGQSVGQFLRDQAGPDVADKIAEIVPMIGGALSSR